MDKLKLKINGKIVEVTQDDNGRYCLNDLFRSSGETQAKKPSEFLRFKGSDLIVVNLNSGESRQLPEDFDTYVILSGKGRGSKTFAPLKIVYKYASFVSKDFENAVYSAFTELSKGNTEKAANIASENTLTPEIIARYEKIHNKLLSLLKEKYPGNKFIYSNIHKLLGKVISGYTPKELTGGGKSVVDHIKNLDHLPAMNAYIASMEIMITLIAAGVIDYHIIAAALQVKTGKNGSILKEIA